jgi:Family of unknown function (DUF6011)
MTTTTAKTITAKFSGKCTKCHGVIPSGVMCYWESGVGIRHLNNCNAQPAPVAPVVAQDSKQVSVTMGVFRKDGRIYVVKPNKDKTRVYAKEVIESPARMTENGAVADFETVYRPGVVFSLTESDRWDLADAKDFLSKFARCIVCGRHLKAAKSVESSIGPVCAKYFAHSHSNGTKCNGHHVKLAHVNEQSKLDTDDARKARAIAAENRAVDMQIDELLEDAANVDALRHDAEVNHAHVDYQTAVDHALSW